MSSTDRPDIDTLINVRAYHKWQARGCPLGDGESDWYAARAELEAELAARSGGERHWASGAPENERLAYEWHVAAFA